MLFSKYICYYIEIGLFKVHGIKITPKRMKILKKLKKQEILSILQRY